MYVTINLFLRKMILSEVRAANYVLICNGCEKFRSNFHFKQAHRKQILDYVFSIFLHGQNS